MAGLLSAFKQYVRDAMPGGALNPETTPQGLLDVAAMSMSPVPYVGDAAGLLADGYRFATDPSSRTWGNAGVSLLGALPIVPGMVQAKTARRLWHGSPDPRWIDRGEAFSGALPRNAQSKYFWASPKQEIAKTYAGLSDIQLMKADAGLGARPQSTAGIRPVELLSDAKILRVKDVREAAKQLGVEWGGENAVEKLLDAAKGRGYDAVEMVIDGGNIAILNPKAISFGAK
jgi:hypothetical protein